MSWNGIERNKLDCLLTDMLPVELSGLFSYKAFYNYLLNPQQQKKLIYIVQTIKKAQYENKQKLFESGWATTPLKYNILKGTDSYREMSIIQPLSALNLYIFLELFQKDILFFFEEHHHYSIRYHKKNNNLYYKKTINKAFNYFYKQVHSVGNAYIEQSGTFYRITPFQSINSFADSRIWRLCNFKFKYFGKIDYKSCFNSIYTHTFKWIIEKNVVDSKEAKCSNLFITLDRILMNINGLTSNGIVVGPEFSRMIAEILLQQIDMEVYYSLKANDLHYKEDYMVFRYVDDIYIFANTEEKVDLIIENFRNKSGKYLLSLNELKVNKEKTPCLPKQWLEKTREMADRISNIFNNKTESASSEYTIVGNGYIPVDRFKDQIIILVKENPEHKRTIVSYLISVLLNNIGKKINGFNLFNSTNSRKALLIIDLTMFIYSFCPSFDQTRKVISLISYINKEINFKENQDQRNKLKK